MLIEPGLGDQREIFSKSRRRHETTDSLQRQLGVVEDVVPSGKNAFPNSFCSEKLRYAGRCTNTSNIIILNETTRVRATFSSSLLQTYR